MPKPANLSAPRRGASTVRLFAVFAIIAVVGVLVWFTVNRIQELNRELAASEKRAEEMNAQLRQYSNELEEALARAQAARGRAEVAEKRAGETEQALRHTEQRAAEVTAERNQAVEAVTVAEAKAARTQAELDEIQKRRQLELDRMQEALSKVAPTTRTPAGMVMTLSDEHFRFDFDKAALRPENKETLSRIAGILLASEGYRLFVDGHTDDVGDASYNQNLSERRATAVRDYLVDAGIPPDVIEIHGFGQKQPLVNAKTAEARAQNRRVEIGIVDTIIHYEKGVRN